MEEHKRVILTTDDGSPTIMIPSLGITYHSRHGAVQESMHVFIKSGLDATFRDFREQMINIFEMGFGTGLNAILTAQSAMNEHRKISYTSIEHYPLKAEELAGLTFENDPILLNAIHNCPWNELIAVNEYFALKKMFGNLLETELQDQFHLIFFDAFSPDDQPELWTTTIFKKLFEAVVANGILVTYCSKSIVRKAMTEAGFVVEKIPGPHGKREMVRARKPATESDL